MISQEAWVVAFSGFNINDCAVCYQDVARLSLYRAGGKPLVTPCQAGPAMAAALRLIRPMLNQAPNGSMAQPISRATWVPGQSSAVTLLVMVQR